MVLKFFDFSFISISYVMMMTSAKICKATEFFLLHFIKLHKVLSISAKFHVYGILQSEIK